MRCAGCDKKITLPTAYHRNMSEVTYSNFCKHCASLFDKYKQRTQTKVLTLEAFREFVTMNQKIESWMACDSCKQEIKGVSFPIQQDDIRKMPWAFCAKCYTDWTHYILDPQYERDLDKFRLYTEKKQIKDAVSKLGSVCNGCDKKLDRHEKRTQRDFKADQTIATLCIPCMHLHEQWELTRDMKLLPDSLRDFRLFVKRRKKFKTTMEEWQAYNDEIFQACVPKQDLPLLQQAYKLGERLKASTCDFWHVVDTQYQHQLGLHDYSYTPYSHWWQGTDYDPAKLRADIHELRMSKLMSEEEEIHHESFEGLAQEEGHFTGYYCPSCKKRVISTNTAKNWVCCGKSMVVKMDIDDLEFRIDIDGEEKEEPAEEEVNEVEANKLTWDVYVCPKCHCFSLNTDKRKCRFCDIDLVLKSELGEQKMVDNVEEAEALMKAYNKHEDKDGYVDLCLGCKETFVRDDTTGPICPTCTNKLAARREMWQRWRVRLSKAKTLIKYNSRFVGVPLVVFGGLIGLIKGVAWSHPYLVAGALAVETGIMSLAIRTGVSAGTMCSIIAVTIAALFGTILFSKTDDSGGYL